MTGVYRAVLYVGEREKRERPFSGRVEGELRGDVASVRITTNPVANYLAGDFRVEARRAAPP